MRKISPATASFTSLSDTVDMPRQNYIHFVLRTLLTICLFSLAIMFISVPLSKFRRPVPWSYANYYVNPFNTSLLPPYDFNKLADLNNFTFKINSLRCSSKFKRSVDSTLSGYFAKFITDPMDLDKLKEINVTSQTATEVTNEWDDVLLTFFIHSSGRNFEKRMTIRNTWGKESNLFDLIGTGEQMRVVFVVGESGNPLINELVQKEATIFKDIVQGNFLDTYRNLTYKHLMGLKWVTYFCPKSQFVLKADDDIFLDVIQLAFILKAKMFQLTPSAMHNLLVCSVERRAKPKRKVSKWQVSMKDYANDSYPDYCNGWLVVMSPQVTFDLYSMSTREPFFWIDDVLITGIYAFKLGLQHLDIRYYSNHRQVDSWLNDPHRTLPPLYENESSGAKIAAIWSKTVSYYRRRA